MWRLSDSTPQHGHDERDASARERETDENSLDASFGSLSGEQDGGEFEQHEADEQPYQHGKQGQYKRPHFDPLAWARLPLTTTAPPLHRIPGAGHCSMPPRLVARSFRY